MNQRLVVDIDNSHKKFHAVDDPLGET
ncbi:uncharacterized protein METZ01_LOCUS293223 [marine metagenome]|uniref:Uncharacterized protein n=1 Tax=marine metagenome TaxID=408172 RepID=A0A382LUH0_9ZZZZ